MNSKILNIYKKPKFPKGSLVYIDPHAPSPDKVHYEWGAFGLVECTYGEEYNNNIHHIYKLMILDKDLKPWRISCWYYEWDLIFIDKVCKDLKYIKL